MDTNIREAITTALSAIANAEAALAEIERHSTNRCTATLGHLISQALPGIQFKYITESMHSPGTGDKPTYACLNTKGVHLFDLEDSSITNKDGNHGETDVYEVFLHTDGTLHLYHRYGKWSKWQGEDSDWGRQYISDLPLEKADYEKVYNGIVDGLRNRLSTLRERVTRHEKLIKRISALKLS